MSATEPYKKHCDETVLVFHQILNSPISGSGSERFDIAGILKKGINKD